MLPSSSGRQNRPTGMHVILKSVRKGAPLIVRRRQGTTRLADVWLLMIRVVLRVPGVSSCKLALLTGIDWGAFHSQGNR